MDQQTREEIEKYLERRDEGFVSQQKLAIKEEVEAELAKRDTERRGRLQLIGALGGVSILALGGLAYENIEATAGRAASASVATAVEKVSAAEQKLNETAEKFEDLRQQIGNSATLVDDTRVEVRTLLAQVDEALSRVNATQGGVGVGGQLIQIVRDLEEIKLQLAQAERIQPSLPQPQPQPGTGDTLDEIFPSGGQP
ncbi:hypothetical protein [uncultured Tateyamaria sp.]|uniref:hypothetical protein n=1 Tax=uncultured Tateyamaria sp. TaxID=455651 RepID=UPI00262DDA95|nr:hypothetical protein [uncultured Tateyamaria sp.]